MAWFDTAAAKARELADFASKKTGEAVEISKLKMQANQINTMIHSTYERVGTLVYDQEKTGVDNFDIIAVCISEIDSLLVDLNEINDRITAIKSGEVCPNCGAPNPSGAGYCGSCGANMNRRASAASSDAFATPVPVYTEDEPETAPETSEPAQLSEHASAAVGAAEDETE